MGVARPVAMGSFRTGARLRGGENRIPASANAVFGGFEMALNGFVPQRPLAAIAPARAGWVLSLDGWRA
jgi:hypothetical protein